MTTLERSIVINATQEQVDAVALNGSRLPEWYAGIQEAKPDSIYPEVGGVVETIYKAAGINFNIKMTSTEFSKGENISLQLEGMITGTNQWVYTPENGGVRVTCTMVYEMPGGGLGQIANKLVVEKMNTENLEKSLANLKALIEGS